MLGPIFVTVEKLFGSDLSLEPEGVEVAEVTTKRLRFVRHRTEREVPMVRRDGGRKVSREPTIRRRTGDTVSPIPGVPPPWIRIRRSLLRMSVFRLGGSGSPGPGRTLWPSARTFIIPESQKFR